MIRSVSGISAVFHCAYTHGNIYYSELINRRFRPGFNPCQIIREYAHG
jgi:hypothetical protein